MNKILFILLMMLIGFSSCSSESDELMTEETLTEADLFVASKEFQNYQNYLMDDARVMRKVLKKLSKGKLEELNELRKAALDAKTEIEYDNVMADINKLVNFDYAARIDKLAKAKYEIFKDVNIPNSEIFKAVQRHNAVQLEPMTRSSSDEQACLHGCYTSYLAASGDCEYEQIKGWDVTDGDYDDYFNNGDWDDDVYDDEPDSDYVNWSEYRGCILNAEMNYDDCVSMCG